MLKKKSRVKAKTRVAVRRERPMAASKKRAGMKTLRSKSPAPLQVDVAALMEELQQQRAIVRELADRQAILDCVTRFSRGVNRRDKDLLRSVFHPDAIDDHGSFVGNREDFLLWIDSVYDGLAKTQHFVTNQTVEIEGDTAHSETYYFVANVPKDSISVILRGGRYIDRLERRDGVWAIVARVCLNDWNCTTGDLPLTPEVLARRAQSGVSTTDKSDPSYIRPLRITREHQRIHPHAK